MRNISWFVAILLLVSLSSCSLPPYTYTDGSKPNDPKSKIYPPSGYTVVGVSGTSELLLKNKTTGELLIWNYATDYKYEIKETN